MGWNFGESTWLEWFRDRRGCVIFFVIKFSDLLAWLGLESARSLPRRWLKGQPSVSAWSSRKCSHTDGWGCGTKFERAASNTCNRVLLRTLGPGNSWDTWRTQQEIPYTKLQQVLTFSFRWFSHIFVSLWQPLSLAMAGIRG